MPFPKLDKPQYPIRLWGLVGYPNVGKSTFSAQMRGPFLVIDADHRWSEVRHLASQDVYKLSENPSDMNDTDRIAALMDTNMPGSGVKTIIVDSLTAIIAPLVTQAIQDKEHRREKNLYAGFKDKAIAMRQLQDAVTKWGVDVLWIYHLNDSTNAEGEKSTKATVSATELIRLTRSVNMQIELLRDGRTGQYGAKVIWARRGRGGLLIPDTTGNWKGMPEKIEASVYDGLSTEDQNRIEQADPTSFASPELAVSWGVEQGAFTSIAHAQNAYKKLLREHQPITADKLTPLWVADVRARMATHEQNGVDHPAEGQGTLSL